MTTEPVFRYARNGRFRSAAIASATLCAVVLSPLTGSPAQAAGPTVQKEALDLRPGATSESLIVAAEPGQLTSVARTLERAGAKVDRLLPIINSVAVRSSAGHASEIESLPGVAVVATDGLLTPMDANKKSNRDSSKSAKETAQDAKEAAERAARDARQAAEKAAKLATEKAAAEKLAKDAAEKAAAEKVAAEKLAKEVADKLAAEKAAADKVAADKAAAEKLAKEAADKLAADKAAKEAADKLATEKAAAEKLAKEAADKVAADKATAEKAEQALKAEADMAAKDAKEAAEKAKYEAEKAVKAEKEKREQEKESDRKVDRDDDGSTATGSRDAGSLEAIARSTGARKLWRRGFTGKGVDVALIDTGVVPVVGAPKLKNGADLSSDSAVSNLRFLDGYGHGTHMAGIIAGRDASVTDPLRPNGGFIGIAPDARVINVKVGAMDGSVHVSQVVSALDWVVQNKNADGMNIRVINLSYGAPATPNWRRDPLAWAAEIAWRKGIVVVAAAGNEGAGHELSSPAYSPAVVAVGATDVETSRDGRGDYAVSPFTSTGTRRRPDLYVPGAHVVSLRAKGSFVDTFQAKGNINDRLTRGSGTSQATAVASGLVALLLEAYPSASPDQIKSMLAEGSDVSGGRRDVTGIEASIDLMDSFRSAKHGLPNVKAADPFVSCGTTWCRGAGDGSKPFVDWATAAWNGSSWSGSSWSGSSWSGSSWSGSSWSGSSWSSSSWSGSSWSGSSWSSNAWAGSYWSGSSWSGSTWSGSSWSGSSWSGSSWSGSSWSGSSWSGSSWSGSSWSSAWGE